MMASSSRPHRQARSGVSYRDAFYEYNDDFCKPQPNTISRKSSSSRNDGKGPARKNLALKGTSRSKDRANAKERAEAVHLQRAINESLSKSSPEAINLSSDHEKDILDYEDETTSKDCVAFQCLLDVASEAVLKGDGHVHKSPRVDEGIAKKQHEGNQILEPPSRPLHGGELAKQVAGREVNVEGGKCKESYQAEDQLKIVFKEDADSSYEGEEEDDTDIDAEEESSDLSEESGCKRKRPVKSQQKGKKAANKHNIDNIYTVQVKKARSIRPLSKVEASSTGNSRTSPPSLCKEQTLQHVKAPGGKENIATSHSSLISKATKNSVLNLKQQIVAGGEANMSSCQSVVESEGPRKLSKSLVFDSTSPGSPGIANFQAHSPTFLHRRVIGLSRRFRPPPLHPYLSKTER